MDLQRDHLFDGVWTILLRNLAILNENIVYIKFEFYVQIDISLLCMYKLTVKLKFNS